MPTASGVPVMVTSLSWVSPLLPAILIWAPELTLWCGGGGGGGGIHVHDASENICVTQTVILLIISTLKSFH